MPCELGKEVKWERDITIRTGAGGGQAKYYSHYLVKII